MKVTAAVHRYTYLARGTMVHVHVDLMYRIVIMGLNLELLVGLLVQLYHANYM